MPPVKSIEDQIAEMLKSSISDNDIEAILKSEAARLKGLIEKYIKGNILAPIFKLFTKVIGKNHTKNDNFIFYL